MSHVAHELQDEFPAEIAKIETLKQSNSHFFKLAEHYRVINREIHRIESGIGPSSDEVLEIFKRQRLRLKDKIAGMLL